MKLLFTSKVVEQSLLVLKLLSFTLHLTVLIHKSFASFELSWQIWRWWELTRYFDDRRVVDVI